MVGMEGWNRSFLPILILIFAHAAWIPIGELVGREEVKRVGEREFAPEKVWISVEVSEGVRATN